MLEKLGRLHEKGYPQQRRRFQSKKSTLLSSAVAGPVSTKVPASAGLGFGRE